MFEVNNELEFYKAKLGSQKCHSRESPKKSSNISTNVDLEDSPRVLITRDKENQQNIGVISSADTTIEVKDTHREQLLRCEQEIKSLKDENNRLLGDLDGKMKLHEKLEDLILVNNRYQEEKDTLIQEIEGLKALVDQKREIDEYVKLLEKERDELKEKIKTHECKLGEYLTELERKNKEIETSYIKKEEIDRYETKVKELTVENDTLKKESHESILKIQHHIVQIQEKDKLERSLRTEIEVLSKKLQDLTKEKENIQAMLPNMHQNTVKIEALEREVKYWKENFEQEQEYHIKQRTEVENLTKGYEDLLKKLIREIGLAHNEGDLVELIIREIRENKTALQMLNEEVLYWKGQAQDRKETALQEKLDLEGKLKQVNKNIERIKGVMQEEDLDLLLKKLIEIQVQTKILNEEVLFWKAKYEDKEKESQEAMQWIENEVRAEWEKKLMNEQENSKALIAAKDDELMNLRLEHETDIRTIKEGYKEVEENCMELLEKNKSLEERVQVLLKEKEINESNEDKSRTSAKNLSVKLQEAEQRIMQQIVDIVALNEKIAKKDKELESWEVKFKALEKSSDQVIKDKIESLERQMKEELQVEKKKYYEESLAIKRETEEKVLNAKRKSEEAKQIDIERKILVIENGKLTRELEELTKEVKELKTSTSELEKEYEVKLNKAKNELEKETQSQIVNLYLLLF